jgi:hypothetical protein
MKDKERANTMTKVCKAERMTRIALIIIGMILLILTVIKEIEKNNINTCEIQELSGEVIDIVEVDDNFTDTDGSRENTYRVIYEAEDKGKLEINYGSSTLHKKGDKVTMYKYNNTYALNKIDLIDKISGISVIKIIDTIYIWLIACMITTHTVIIKSKEKNNNRSNMVNLMLLIMWIMEYILIASVIRVIV